MPWRRSNIKEILQEVALYSLWRGGFFESRIPGGPSFDLAQTRALEDLDFILQQPTAPSIGPYLDRCLQD